MATQTANATTALYDAALANNLAFNAKWYTSFNDFEVTQVGTDKNGGEAEGFPSWGYAVNYTTANVGGCQFQLAPGSEVLWAYNYFNLKHLLNLSGPSSVVIGVPFTVHVTDGQTGEPVSGAAMGEDVNGVTTTIPPSSTTNSSGDATITPTHTGTIKLKATQSESVRSNGLTITIGSTPCSSCGASTSNSVVSKSVPLPDVASTGGIQFGHHYTRHSAPRLLSGSVEVPVGATLREVRIGLQRRFKGRCYDFSGSRERFVHVKCGRVSFFPVGTSQSFTYLLPSRLPAGSYTYQVETVEADGHVNKPVKGVSSVSFTVG